MSIFKRIIGLFDTDDDIEKTSTFNDDTETVSTLRLRLVYKEDELDDYDDDWLDTPEPPTEVVDSDGMTTFDGTERYAVEIRGSEHFEYGSERASGSGIAHLVLEPDNVASASAIMVYIDGNKVGYVANEDTRIHSFLYLLDKKNDVTPTTRYDRGFVFLPTIPVMVEMLRDEIEAVFDAFDECVNTNMTYESLFDEDIVELRNNLQREIVKYKNEILCYDFPVDFGRRINPLNGYGYFSCDGLVFYWSCAASLLINSYTLLHEANELRAEYEQLQQQIKQDYAEIGTYAGVSRKHGITAYMVKKYLTEDFRDYRDGSWDVLDLSTFEVFVNHMNNLKEWNRTWKRYRSSVNAPYGPE